MARTGPKFAYKLDWAEEMTAHAGNLIATGMPIVLAGKYNIVPEPCSIYETRSYDANTLI